MTVYARNDVASISVGKTHGGCGETHRRPMNGSAPMRTWGLTCPQCEGHLAHDPLWGANLAEIPDTPDEVSARENVQRNTARSRDDLMALALAKIAGLPVAEFLGEMIGHDVDRGTVRCSAGHENFPSAKFCAECGSKMLTGVTDGTSYGLPSADTDDGDVPGMALAPGAYTPEEINAARGRPAPDAANRTPVRQARAGAKPRRTVSA